MDLSTPSASLPDTVATEGAVPLTPTTSPVKRPSPLRNSSARRLIGWFVLYGLLLIGSVAFLYPFVWMLVSSFRTNAQVGSSGISVLPQQLRFANYSEALSSFNFWRYLLNSLLTTLIPIFGTVLSSSLAGFAFARMNVRGSRVLFYIVLATMLFPGEVVLIPQFILFKELGMIDTLYPLILPAFFGSPFFIFMYRQFYARMPDSLTEASTLDGCGWFKTWWLVYSPLARPVTGAISVMLFMSYWNNFMGPQIYINSDRWKTLPLGLSGFTSTSGNDIPHLMAATVVVTLPCVILFFCTQRLFLSGASFAGTDK